MKRRAEQFEALKTSIVSEIAVLIARSHSELRDSLSKKIDGLENIFVGEFERLHSRIDGVEENLVAFREDVTVEFKTVRERMTDHERDTEKKFEEINSAIQLRQLILE